MPGKDFQIGETRVYPQRGLLKRNGQSIRITPKAMAVLQCLVEAENEVVSRNALLDRVWPGAEVSDDVLTQCVSDLRRAFGDSAQNSEVIETIPKKGLRLIGPASPISNIQANSPPQAAGAKLASWKIVVPAVGILVILAVLAFVAWPIDGNNLAEIDDGISIAVMPFDAEGIEEDSSWVAGALAWSLIDHLTQMEGLLVIGPGSSFGVGRAAGLQQVAETLDVNHVIHGSVRQVGDKLQISVRLVQSDVDAILWSETYNRPNDDLIEVKEEIAGSVANALAIKLGVGELGRMAGTTRNVQAWEAAAGIQPLYYQPMHEMLPKQLALLDRAVTLDPEYGQAWLDQVYVYHRLGLTFGERRDWRLAQEEALANAIRLMPESARPYAAAAHTEIERSQWIAAQINLDKGQQLGGDLSPEYLGTQIDLLTKVGRAEDAMPLVSYLQRSEPLLGWSYHYLGKVLAMRGQSESALKTFARSLEVPIQGDLVTEEALVTALGTLDISAQRAWLARVVEREAEFSESMGFNTEMAQMFGQRDESLNTLRDHFNNQTGHDYWVTIWAAYYSDIELALASLQRSPHVWQMWMPILADVRQTPQFAQLMEEVGLVEYWERFGWGDFCRPDSDGILSCH